ncbi:hypothetical protein DMUE_2826 [Dictyocoela muelleri]|nr:hypothetical protein DMUE_2826 [Dictyocoela muelleri]
MDIGDCYEFICGACTKSMFKLNNSKIKSEITDNVNDITYKCTKIHNVDRKNHYLENIDIIFDFEKDVYHTYRHLILQINRDIENNKKILKSYNKTKLNKIFTKIYEKFDYDIKKQEVLLEISSFVLNNYRYEEEKYKVCEVCSSIIEIKNLTNESECTHVFHNDIKFIRERAEQMKRKLKL